MTPAAPKPAEQAERAQQTDNQSWIGSLFRQASAAVARIVPTPEKPTKRTRGGDDDKGRGGLLPPNRYRVLKTETRKGIARMVGKAIIQRSTPPPISKAARMPVFMADDATDSMNPYCEPDAIFACSDVDFDPFDSAPVDPGFEPPQSFPSVQL
jgi:hypothetical protein